jgi:DNA repair protein RadD
MELRDYQQAGCDGVEGAWAAGHRYVLLVQPTGGGKTVSFSHLVKRHNGPAIVLAHRAELIGQMSLALAREGVRHRIIGAKSLVSLCIRAHTKELRYSYYDPTARVAVASVQTVSCREDQWYKQVTLWVHDEAHHLLRENQFGQAVKKFPNAKGLGVTATPGRTDGKGLGAHADGFFQTMVMGPTPRALIDRGFLSEYKIYCPPNNLKLDDVRHSANGDFNPIDLKVATRKSTVLGDVVEHYAKHASGKLGLTFADSIENAGVIAGKFREAGIPAEVLSGKTPADLRSNIIAKFQRREIHQIVSCSLIDEGFDCPAVEVVSDAAASESFNRFAQRFGRGLRVLAGKPYMIYFDHVGNVLRHGLPDSPRRWSLDRRDKRASKDNDAIPIRICANTDCLQPYERFHKECPYCGFYPEPALRSGPEFVDGDLTELDPAALAALRGSITRVDGDFYAPQGLEPHAQMAARNNHLARQQAQKALRNAIAWYAGAEHAQGYSQSDSYRRFYFRFGIDVANAQLLGSREAGELAGRINAELSKVGVDGTRNWEEHIHY